MQIQSALGRSGAISSFRQPYTSAEPPCSRFQALPPSVLTKKFSIARYYGRRHSQLTLQAHRTPEGAAHTHKRQGLRNAPRALTCSAFQPKSFLCFADTALVPVSQLLSLVTKKIGQHAVAVGLSAAMLASCLSAGASEVMR